MAVKMDSKKYFASTGCKDFCQHRSNKKGISVSIVLLVFLTVILCAAALFNFYFNKSGVEAKVLDPAMIDSVYVQKNQADSMIDYAGNIAFFKAYSKIVGEYYGRDRLFASTGKNSEIEGRFKDYFIEDFRSVVNSYGSAEPAFLNLKKKINDGEFKITFSGNVISFSCENSEVSATLVNQDKGLILNSVRQFDKIENEVFGVKYIASFSKNFSFDKYVLKNFSELNKIVENCKNADINAVDGCVSTKLPEFSVLREKTDSSDILILIYKKKFFMESSFQEIKLYFNLK